MKDFWITEKEICDDIERNGLLEDLVSEEFFIAREAPILKKYTPDFLIFEKVEGKLIISPVEVKITCTVDAVVQAAKYAQILKTIDGSKVTAPILIARYFDEKSLDLIRALDWPAFEVVCEKKTVIDLKVLESKGEFPCHAGITLFQTAKKNLPREVGEWLG